MGKTFTNLADPLHLFTSQKTPEPPPIAKPPVMPLPDDKAALDAKRRAVAARQAASGRTSTIFTDNPDALGG